MSIAKRKSWVNPVVVFTLTGALMLPAESTLAAPLSPPGSGVVLAVIESIASDLKQTLNLTPAQQLQFARAVAKTEDVVPQLIDNHEAMAAAARDEFDEAVPDLDALAVQRDDMVLENLALRQSARAEWLALYDMLSPEQVADLKGWIEARRARREGMRQLFGGGLSGMQ